MALRNTTSVWRKNGDTIAFVPTMGNLHAGHLDLIRHAQALAERVVVSIFVNPMQFNDQSDYDAYPITVTEDKQKLINSRVDCLFQPAAIDIYPNGIEDTIRVEIPGLSDILCGEFRPGHFVGVATVVTKLFNIVMPDIAIFGEKDFQQLILIRRLVAELCLPITIESVATVREQDGLAISSRNRYLSVEQRRMAPLLYQILSRAREQLLEAKDDYSEVEDTAVDRLKKAGFRPEYCAVRRADTLGKPLDKPAANNQDLLILAAAWLGEARLIDNLRI